MLACRKIWVRENFELYGLADEEQYVKILNGEFAATRHPSQADAYILDGLPFYAPRRTSDHILILGFNYIPLPYSLVAALISHPDLFADDILVRWTQEQDLIFEATLGQLREQAARHK